MGWLKKETVEFESLKWPDAPSYIAYCKSQSHLELVKASSHDTGLTLFSSVRNEAEILPAFLDHYRRLGVERFVMIDNASDDSTTQLLEAQPDVHLFFTRQSYGQAISGAIWKNALAAQMSRNQWALFVDADELLVYEDYDTVRLPDLIGHLRNAKLSRLFAPMIDVYEIDGRLYFDAAPEETSLGSWGLVVHGGPRMRMAKALGSSSIPCMSKSPLLLFDNKTSYTSIHFPHPRCQNNPFCFARLLHMKITTRFRTKIDEALTNGEYWHSSEEYRVYDKWCGADLLGPHTRGYEGPQSLISAGLMDRPPWRANSLRPYIWRDSRRDQPLSISGLGESFGSTHPNEQKSHRLRRPEEPEKA